MISCGWLCCWFRGRFGWLRCGEFVSVVVCVGLGLGVLGLSW